MKIIDSIKNLVMSGTTDPARSGQLQNAPDGLTIGRILDIANGIEGGDFLRQLYSPRFYGRNEALEFITLNRIVNMISEMNAKMLANGWYRIVDDQGKVNNSPKSKALRRLIANGCDGFQPSSYVFKDAFADLLLTGNCLLKITRGTAGRVIQLERIIEHSALVMGQGSKGRLYDYELAENRNRYRKTWSEDIVHARWAHTHSYNYSNNSTRMGFAKSPIVMMRPAIGAALELEQMILKYAQLRPIKNIAVSYAIGNSQVLTAEQLEELKFKIDKELKSSRGLYTGFDFNITDVTPQLSKEALERSEYQSKLIAQAYGVAAPTIGIDTSSWGSGVAELNRFLRIYCLEQYFQIFTDELARKCLDEGLHFEGEWMRLNASDAKSIKEMTDAMRGDAQRPGTASIAEIRKMQGLPPYDIDGEIPETINTDGSGRPNDDDGGGNPNANLFYADFEEIPQPLQIEQVKDDANWWE